MHAVSFLEGLYHQNIWST